MNNTNSLVASTAEQIGEAANEFFAAISRGEEPSIAQFSERYPEIAEHIRRTFPALLLVGNCSTDGDQRELRPHSDGSKTLGDFRLVREIGRGGMGTVFEAEQISMGRHVALKVLPFAALVHQSSLQRFRNEVRAAAALNHPNIVPVYFIGEERGVHFYAMQLIRGQTLADMIHVLRKAHQPASALNINASANDETPTIDSATVPPATKRVEQARISTVAESRQAVERYRTAARLGIEAAEALQHAHDQGVLHRDIKPSNLLLDGDGKLYVTDFGLARIEADAGMTMTGDIVGTLRYMAPEQALAKRVVIDHRADIYSLGATLYELLTLQPAFGETDRSELLKQIAFEEPRLLRKLDRRIPAELETIVLRAMAKNPDERYQTAQQLADDLRAFLENRPIKAKPPTWREQITKWSRRHPAAVWAGALFLVSTTLVSSASIVLVANAYKREAIARSAAEAQVRREGEIFKKVRLSMNDMLVAPAVGKGIWVELPSSMREEFAKKAFQYYESLMQEESSDPSLQFETAVTCWLLGSMQVSLKQYQPAEKLLCRSTAILERLCRDYPADYSYRQQLAKSNSMLGATLFAEGQLVEAGAPTLKAIELYKSLIREGPDLAAYVPELGIAYKRLGQLRRKQGESTKEMSDEYLALLRHAVARGPQYGNIHNALAFKLDEKGLGDDALAAEREAVRLEPHETTWRENLSYFLNKQGRFDESIATLEEGIQLDPDAAALHNNLGTALANKGLIDKSITEYRTAIRLNPKHPMFRRNLGESLVEKAQQNEAIAEQVECLRLPPLDAAPHYRFADAFGRALEQKAAIEEALATCQAGLQFEPRDVKLLNAVGEIFLQKGSYDEAIATFRKAIQLEPNALGYSNLGLALQRKGQLDEAVHSMREAVRLDTNDATAHHNLSLFLNDLGAELKSKGRLDEAISNAREAVQLAPNDALAHRNLGIFLNDRGRLNEAMVQYHEAIRLDPADAQTYELLGVILHQKGRPGEAIEKLK